MTRIALMCRLFWGGRRTRIKEGAEFTVIFLIILTFVLYFVVMTDNEVWFYDELAFDYLLMDVDDEAVRTLASMDGVSGCSAACLIGTTVTAQGWTDAVNMDAYMVDAWDISSLTFWGDSRSIVGRTADLHENSLILDVLTARTLHVGIGDHVTMLVGEAALDYQVGMIVAPEYCLNDNIAVCLYSERMRETWLQQHASVPEYSLVFLKTEGEEISDYLRHSYLGPMGQELEEEDRSWYVRQTVLRRTDLKEEAAAQLIYTPPAVLAVCLIGIILLLIFIWHEDRRKITRLKRELEILSRLGMEEKYLRRAFSAAQSLLVLGSLVLAGVVSKLLIFDRVVTVYYLSWTLLLRLLGLAALVSLTLSVCAGRMAGQKAGRKVERSERQTKKQ